MGEVRVDITMSLDIAGPGQSLERPLGEGGERLHEWLFRLASFRERHGLFGGEINGDSEVVEESLRATGAVVMGRRMFQRWRRPMGGRSQRRKLVRHGRHRQRSRSGKSRRGRQGRVGRRWR